MKHLIAQNEKLKTNIQGGPGWTESQTKELNTVIKDIELKKTSITRDAAKLRKLKGEIRSNEEAIVEKDHLREKILQEVERIDFQIDSSRKVYRDIEAQINRTDEELEMLELSTMQEKDKLRSLKSKHKNVISKQKCSKDELVSKQSTLEKNTRKLRECFKTRDELQEELRKQKEKNQQIDVKNTEKVCHIADRKEQVQKIMYESSILLKKKELLSQKIVQVEEKRIQLEEQRDKLKMKINQLVHGDLNSQKRECETHRRQKEALKREINLLDRKRGLSEKSAQTVLDLIKSSEIAGKSLQHDLRASQTRAAELEAQSKSLSEDIEKHQEQTKIESNRAQHSLTEYSEQEALIQRVQKDLDKSDSMLKQKQYLCEALKNECNAQSKILVRNHEEIERVRREINVVDRQANQLKMVISNIEVELVSEHFDHHNSIADKDALQTEMVVLQKQIDEMENVLKRKEKEILQMHQSIDLIDKECDKHVKEYGAIIGYRDSIGNVLLRKNEDLEKIQEKIKTQQSLLHHCDIRYQEQMIQIAKMVEKMKDMTIKKTQLDKESLIFDEHLKQYNCLETQIQHERNQHVALKEELGRPMNIHRWRILEHRNPQKFEKIQKIQKLQTCLINVSGEVGDREKAIREAELEYLQIKRVADRQPQMSEISQQANLYQSVVNEKSKEKSNIEIDLSLVKEEVGSLRQALKNLDVQREDMKAKWIDAHDDVNNT